MASPGAGIGAAVIQTPSLIPLVQQVSNTLDFRETRARQEKEALNKQFSDEINSIDYRGLTTDQIDALKSRTGALVDMNATMIRNANGDPRAIDNKTILKEQNSIRALGQKWRQFDQEISTVSKALEMDKDNIYDKEAMNTALVSMTYEIGPDGKRKAKEDIQSGDAIAMLENPAFMDPDAYIKKQINLLEEQKTNQFETQSGIPGFGTLGFTTEQTTRVPWQLDANGQPKLNPDTGEKMLDLDSWAQIVLNDPQARKNIQHFAAKAGLTVNEWLYRKALEHNATPKTIAQVHYPRVERSSGSDKSKESNDVRRVFLDTVSGLLNQSPELVGNLPQADELDAEGVPYRDATEVLQPYFLTKNEGKSLPFYKVYVSDGNPGEFYVKDTEGSQLRTVTQAEATNMVNAAGTLNTALRGIDTYALKNGYISGQNSFNPDVNINQDPVFINERQQLRKGIVSARQQAQQELKTVAGKVRDKSWLSFATGQKALANEINPILEGKTIRVPGRAGTTRTIKNPKVSVDISLFGDNTITISGDGKDTQMTANEFADLIASDNFIVGEDAVYGTKQTAPATGGGEFDNLGQ